MGGIDQALAVFASGLGIQHPLTISLRPVMRQGTGTLHSPLPPARDHDLPLWLPSLTGLLTGSDTGIPLERPHHPGRVT